MKSKKCPCCGADFTLKYYLKQIFTDFRIKKFHEKNELMPIKCSTCGEEILQTEDLLQNMIALYIGFAIVGFIAIYFLDALPFSGENYLLFALGFCVFTIVIYMKISIDSYTSSSLFCYKYMEKQKEKTTQESFSKNPFIIFFAILGTLMMLGSIGALWYFPSKASEIRNIHLLAYSKNRVVFNGNDTLYHTDRNGKLISKGDFKSLGLKNNVGDIAFYKNSILLTNGRSYSVFKCPLPLSKCIKLTDIPKTRSKVEAIDIAVTPNEKNFYLLYSRARKIYYFDTNGTKLYSLQENLNYPNDIIALNNNKIIIADTDNKRLLALKHDKQKVSKLWELDMPIGFNFDFVYPANFSKDKNGNLWALVMDGNLEYDEVMVFNGKVENKKISNKTLFTSNLKMPQSIENAGDFMLISDTKKYGIYKLNLKGEIIKEFGDENIKNAMAKLRKEKSFYLDGIDLSYFGMVFSVVILVLCAIYDYFEKESKSSVLQKLHVYTRYKKEFSKQDELQPDERGIIWLKGSIDNRLSKELFFIVGVLLFVYLFIIGFFYFYFDTIILPPISPIKLFCFALTFIVFALVAIYSYSTNDQIGVLENTIYIKNKSGKIVVDKAQNVRVSKFFINISNQSIPFIRKNLPTFNQSQFNHYILPILKNAKPANEIDILLSQMLR